MKLNVLRESFSVCKINDRNEIPFDDPFVFIGKTDEELSLVCQTEHAPERCAAREDGWRAFRVEGMLEFSLVGILSKISGILAAAGIGIFAVSTFNTDYILVKDHDLRKAMEALGGVYDIMGL